MNGEDALGGPGITSKGAPLLGGVEVGGEIRYTFDTKGLVNLAVKAPSLERGEAAF